MQKKVSIIIICVIAVLLESFMSAAYAQPGELLNAYIRQGLQNNLALQQKKLDLEKSLKALKEANSLFYPSVGFEAQYFLASGGRSIDFPVGTLMNPVYSSLNEILSSMGEPGRFSAIPDQSIQFLPNDYHDTKVRVIMPLINTEIYYNRKIKKENISAAEAELNVFMRELIREMKIGYYRYLQSVMIADAYSSALELVTEVRRVNQKLMANGISGPERFYRIEAERMQITAQLNKAENERRTAASYFNFLLNRPLQEPVIIDSLLFKVQFQSSAIPTEFSSDREELLQLNSAIKSSDYYTRMKKSYILPVISNITDIGYQGYSYTFNSDQRYIMNTINLSWPIFNGFQNRRNIALANIQTTSLHKKYEEIENQINLQNIIAVGNLESSLRTEQANKSAMVSAEEYYKAISSQYALGQKSLLDLLDARNQLTGSQISFHVASFETLIRYAELERAKASIDLLVYTQINNSVQ